MRLRKETPRQTAVLNIRMYPEEKEIIEKAAKKADKSTAEYVRDKLLGK